MKSPILFVTTFILLIPLVVQTNLWESTCPTNCQCYVQPEALIELDAVKTVSCVGILLMRVPKNLSLEIEALDLSSNVLGFASDVSFESFGQLEKLRHLDLSYNRIRTIIAAKPLQQLALLNLSHNEIQSINKFMFKDFISMKYLDLENNSIARIALSSLDLPQLVYLNLKSNRIVSFRSDFAFGTPRLNTLLLSSNFVSRIPNGLFRHLSSIDLILIDDNRISRIEDYAFHGLEQLGTLDLSRNTLRQVPTVALQKIGSIRLVLLDKNPIRIVPRMAFDSVNTSQVSLCDLEDLLLIESRAFYNMTHLDTAWIKSNHRLVYISRETFYLVPSIRVLDIRNNNLYVFEDKILTEVTSPVRLYVSGNPFLCDCNLRWIHEIIKHHSPYFNHSYDIAISDARVNTEHDREITSQIEPDVEDKLVTQCLDRDHDQSFKLAELERLPKECGPFLLPLFQPVDRAPVTATLSYICRGVGVPQPDLKWKLPSGKMLSNNQCDDRICVHDETLMIEFLHEEDAGIYECVASSLKGTFKRTLHLEVFNVNIKIIPLSVTSTFVTLAWNASVFVSSDFLLKYKLSEENEDAYQLVPVSSKVFSYTLNRMQPGKTYVVWLCLRRDNYSILVSSLTITMRDDDFFAVTGIQRNYFSFIILVLISSSLSLACICFCAVRAWKWRKLRQLNDLILTDSSSVITQAAASSIVASDSASNNVAFISYSNDDFGLLEHESTQ